MANEKPKSRGKSGGGAVLLRFNADDRALLRGVIGWHQEQIAALGVPATVSATDLFRSLLRQKAAQLGVAPAGPAAAEGSGS